MSGIMDKVKDVAQGKEDQAAQPGDKVEGAADNFVNQGMLCTQSWSILSHSLTD